MSATIRAPFFCLFGQLVISLFFVQSAIAQTSPKIIQITPTGDLEANQKVSQIVFQFDQAAVALGDMDRTGKDIPIDISPAVDCQWRWLDQTTLSCQIPTVKPLQSASTYTIKVRADSNVRDGKAFAAETAASFTMQRPEIEYGYFEKYASPQRPQFRVMANVPLDRSSLSDHIFFRQENGRRIGVDVETANLSEEGEAAQADPGTTVGWLVTPDSDLTEGMSFTLETEAGIKALNGNAESTVAKTLQTGAAFDKFKFTGINCYLSSGDDEDNFVTIDPDTANASSTNHNQLCDPMFPINITFSSPVATAQLKGGIELTPDPYGKSSEEAWEAMPTNEDLYEVHTEERTYWNPVPGPLKAERMYHVRLKGGDIKDLLGRTLDKDVEFTIPLGARRPRLSPPSTFSTLESQVDTKPALYLTNIEDLLFRYHTLTSAGRSTGSTPIKPYPVRNISYKLPLPLKEPLGDRSGMLVGMLSSPQVKNENQSQFFVQRTPYSVHVKISHFNSLVWVTDFQTGKAVPGATVEILAGTVWNLLKDADVRTKGTTDKSGIAILAGTKEIDPNLNALYQWNRNEPVLIARVTRGADMAIVPLGYDFRSDTKYYASMQRRHGTIQTWGTTAQGIYRAGDTMQYKIFVRDINKDTFVFPPKEKYKLEILDPLGKKVMEQLNVTLSEFGTFSGSFPIPRSGAVGWYTFRLTSSFYDRSWEPMRVLVSDFTPAPFRVTVDLDKQQLHADEKLTVKTSAAFHAGGAYGGAKGRLTVTASTKTPEFSQPVLQDFVFGNEYYVEGKEVFRKEYVLSSAGQDSAEVSVEDDIPYGTLMIESAVSDERGKNVAGFANVPFIGRERYVGLNINKWVLERNTDETVRVAVVDGKGEPLTGASVNIRIERDEVHVAQVKSAGNAFLPNFEVTQVVVKEEKVTSTGAPLEVHFTPPEVGLIRIIADITDANNRLHNSKLERWVVGKGDAIWQTEADEQIRVTPERASYAVGDTARFLVQNPFPGTDALVSIERDGIISQHIEKLNDAASVIEIPVESRHAPGFFLSVVLASPRVADAPIQNGVDLGKPAYRTGYAQVSVPRSDKQLQLTVQAAQPRYQPGDEVVLDISALDFAGKPASGELAVTVLDQAVLDLIQEGKSLYDVYKAFYQLGSLGVMNFNILRQIVGRQNFERKGMTEAGDGGRGNDLRSIDSFVASWEPLVTLNAKGKAQIKFKAPANLTSWKVFAIGLNRADRMGLGEGEFAVAKDIEIRPVNPQIVRVGDTFTARFSVMNRTQSEQHARVTLTARGGAQSDRSFEDVLVKPNERAIVDLEVKPGELTPIILEASAVAGAARDGLKVSIPVLPTIGKERVMQTIALDAPQQEIAIKVPGDISTQGSSLQLALFPSLVGDLSAPFSYMRNYPYSCWEQRLSKAISAAWFVKGNNNLPQSFTWEGAKDLVTELFTRAPDFQGESGGMAYFKPDKESIDPFLSAYTGLIFEWLQELGYQPPQPVVDKLYEYLLNLLRNDPPNINYYTKRDLQAVRIIAARVLAAAKRIEKEELLRLSTDIDKFDIFFQSLMLEAYSLLHMDKEQATITALIQSKGNISSDAVVFNNIYSDYGYRLLSSDVRGGCQLLATLMKTGAMKTVSADWTHKVVRGIVKQKLATDRWLNTQENVFCINGLRRYAASEGKFDAPLEVTASVEGGAFAKATFTSPSDIVQLFNRDLVPTEVGIERQVVFRKSGDRKGYATLGLEFPQRTGAGSEKNVGIEIYREYSIKDGDRWKVLPDKLDLKLGDVVRVDLYLVAPGLRTFLALEDKLPGAFETINRQLATSSHADSSAGKVEFPEGSRFNARNFPDGGFGYREGLFHREQRNDSVRFYAEYLEPGNYHMTHFVQVVAPGQFTAPAAHTEEMYTPAVYGDSTATTVRVAIPQ